MQLVGDFLVRFGLPYQIHDLLFSKTEVVVDRTLISYRLSASLADPL